MSEGEPGLKKTLSGLHLWGIAVGLVISGEYFGWSYGGALAGTLGFLVTTVFIAVMYTSFIFSFTELTTAIPHAGGPFAYSYRAFGPIGGYIAGFSTLVEFVFASPAIALAIGAYLNVQFPALDARTAAVGAYAGVHRAEHSRSDARRVQSWVRNFATCATVNSEPLAPNRAVT
jgi:ethanolamine permease